MENKILKQTISPRFADTDALGHINNTVLPVWFEDARTPLFKIFTPDLDPAKWQLIIAKIEVDFIAELFYTENVEIRTYLEKIGNSSMVIIHEAWQTGRLCAKGKAIMVHYDHQQKCSKPLTAEHKSQLQIYLSVTEPSGSSVISNY